MNQVISIKDIISFIEIINNLITSLEEYRASINITSIKAINLSKQLLLSLKLELSRFVEYPNIYSRIDLEYYEFNSFLTQTKKNIKIFLKKESPKFEEVNLIITNLKNLKKSLILESNNKKKSLILEYNNKNKSEIGVYKPKNSNQ